MANNDAILQYAQLKRYDAWIKKYIDLTRASLIATDITGKTIDLNTLTSAEKLGKRAEYICTTEEGSVNITNKPLKFFSNGGVQNDGGPEYSNRYTAFRLIVENIGWESDLKYTTIQTYTDQWANSFVRINYGRTAEDNIWTEWTEIGSVAESVDSINSRAKLWEDNGGGKLSLKNSDGEFSVNMNFMNDLFKISCQEGKEGKYSIDPITWKISNQTLTLTNPVDTNGSPFVSKANLPTSLPANGGSSDDIKVQSNVVRTSTSGTTFYKYEGSDSTYLTTYEIPYGTVIVQRMMDNAKRGLEIAWSWDRFSRKIWIRYCHDAWSNWLEIFPSNTVLEDNLKAYTDSKIPSSLPANGGNSDTVDNLHAWQYGVVNEVGSFNFSDYLSCKYDLFGDKRYSLFTSSGKEVRCHYAATAGNAATVNNHTVNIDVPANAKFTDTTYGFASSTQYGLMTASDWTKLNGIATGANKTVVDSSLSTTSLNPVQNNVVTAAINNNTALANSMFKSIMLTVPVQKNSSSMDTSVSTHIIEYNLGLVRGDGTTANFPAIQNIYYTYGLASSNINGLMPGSHFNLVEKYRTDHYNVIEKYKAKVTSSANYTLTSTDANKFKFYQDAVNGYLYQCSCYGGIVSISGYLEVIGTATDAANLRFATGSFPVPNGDRPIGIMYNTSSPNINNRLMAGFRENEGNKSVLIIGGSAVPGLYFFTATYPIEICGGNLPY